MPESTQLLCADQLIVNQDLSESCGEILAWFPPCFRIQVGARTHCQGTGLHSGCTCDGNMGRAPRRFSAPSTASPTSVATLRGILPVTNATARQRNIIARKAACAPRWQGFELEDERLLRDATRRIQLRFRLYRSG